MAIGTRDPWEVFVNQPVCRVLRRAWHEMPPADLVLVEHAALAPLITERRAENWALTLQNIPSVTAEHAIPLQRGRRQRWLFERERRKAARFEAAAVDAFDLVFSVSPDDARHLPGATVVVPNGVDLDRFSVAPLPDAPEVVFTGTLCYLPNVDGLLWFCDEIWPRVRAWVPDARFRIVGRDPVTEVSALADRVGVELHPDVDSIVPYLERARLAVVPLRMGSGTRLKALEALASGRPVVGTSLGLAGMRSSKTTPRDSRAR
jgi:glycosyltransferase involved in cell wall biosynthesis